MLCLWLCPVESQVLHTVAHLQDAGAWEQGNSLVGATQPQPVPVAACVRQAGSLQSKHTNVSSNPSSKSVSALSILSTKAAGQSSELRALGQCSPTCYLQKRQSQLRLSQQLALFNGGCACAISCGQVQPWQSQTICKATYCKVRWE